MAYVLLPVSLLAAALFAVPALFGDFFAYQLGLYLIYGIAAQGVGYVWGKTGALPLGQALFFGVAAYISAMLLRDGANPLAQIALFLIAAALLGLGAFFLGALIFRGRSDSGPYFSLITLALVMIAEQIAGTAVSITGGFNGLSGFDAIGGLDPFSGLYYVIVAVVIFVTAGLLTLNRLPIDLIVRGVADNEPRLQLLGYPTHQVKAFAFGLSAVLAAIAGGLFASHQGIVTPTSTGFALSAQFVILAAVGGRQHVLGPLFGAVLIGLASAELRDVFPYWELVIAAVFIIVVLKAKGGLAEILERPIGWLRRRSVAVEAKPTIAAPPLLSGPGPQPVRFDDVRLKIGVVDILNGVTFTTPASGVISVIGPNGAGKTSALNTMSGVLPTTSGAIWIGDDRLDGRPPHKALGKGVGRKLQVPSVFASMTVAENLTIAMMAGRAGVWDHFRRAPLRWSSGAQVAILTHPGVPLRDRMDQVAGELPQGHRQFLELAITVASEPCVLLLDEPCAGLSADETKLMTALVRQYQQHSSGLIIMIEHDMSIVEAISDKVLVLHQGEVLTFDTYEAVRADKMVQSVYAGGVK